jgi:sugar phosphate isomerase/epimerase
LRKNREKLANNEAPMKVVVTATPGAARSAPILLRGPLAESFALAARHEYDGIEIHLRDAHDIDWDATVSLSDRYRLPVTTLGTGMMAGIDGLTFTDADAAVRAEAVRRTKEHIALAARLGSAVTIGLLNGNLGRDPEQAECRRAHHFACLDACAQAAGKLGVAVFLEPLNRFESDWFNTTEQALAILSKLGAANVKYLADTFHMNIEEADIGASIRRAGGRLGYVHLVDTNRRVPGQGHLAAREVLQALAHIRYDGCLSFECLPLPDAEAAMTFAMAHVRRLQTEVRQSV